MVTKLPSIAPNFAGIIFTALPITKSLQQHSKSNCLHYFRCMYIVARTRWSRWVKKASAMQHQDGEQLNPIHEDLCWPCSNIPQKQRGGEAQHIATWEAPGGFSHVYQALLAKTVVSRPSAKKWQWWQSCPLEVKRMKGVDRRKTWRDRNWTS